jgi:hypothetical protein
MSKHTPGPWKESKNVMEQPVIESVRPDNDAFIICQTFGPDKHDNARLIAAAPELLEALRTALDASWNGPMPDYARDEARAAIAKATGEDEA